MEKRKNEMFLKRIFAVIVASCIILGIMPKFTLTAEAHDNNGAIHIILPPEYT